MEFEMCFHRDYRLRKESLCNLTPLLANVHLPVATLDPSMKLASKNPSLDGESSSILQNTLKNIWQNFENIIL